MSGRNVGNGKDRKNKSDFQDTLLGKVYYFLTNCTEPFYQSHLKQILSCFSFKEREGPANHWKDTLSSEKSGNNSYGKR